MTNKRGPCPKFVAIGSVLDQVIQQYRPMAEASLIRVWEIWEPAVGTGIAACARPAAFRECNLLVHVSNSTWLHHLRFLEQEMIAKINGALGGDYVRKITLKIGPV